jgi:hypothetical protein
MDFLLDTVPKKMKYREYLQMVEEQKKIGKMICRVALFLMKKR